MARLDPGWVVAATDYARVRTEYAALVSRARARRRLRIGSHCTLQFETPEFALWHVHELLRVEGYAPDRVVRTVDDVAPWCPGPGQLTATLMIDGADARDAQRITESLAQAGAVSLMSPAGTSRGRPVDPGLPGEPVWYLAFDVPPPALERGCVCRTSWSQDAITLPSETAAALADDLRRGLEPPMLHRLLAEGPDSYRARSRGGSMPHRPLDAHDPPLRTARRGAGDGGDGCVRGAVAGVGVPLR